VGSEEAQMRAKEFLRIDESAPQDDTGELCVSQQVFPLFFYLFRLPNSNTIII
jgi:hypothetical protein